MVLEVGVGFNTPSVIRWPGERAVMVSGDAARLIRVNRDHPETPAELDGRAAELPYDAVEGLRLLGL